MCLIWRVGCDCLFRNLLPFCQGDLHVQCDAGCKDVWQKTRGRKQRYPQPFVDGQGSPETAWGLSTGIATTQEASPFSKALLRGGVLTVEAFGLWIVRDWGNWEQRMLLLRLTVLKSLWSPIDGKSPGRRSGICTALVSKWKLVEEPKYPHQTSLWSRSCCYV